ncbi:glycosyltransferase family 2 protein [Poseidonibacter lekithochrous]|uniref:glycosyltransferase family 2 protein n=1 Tax=Poseidonibacter TaxID=2321187 RepID=UPI001C09CC30|nr:MULTISPECIES: glycosyltransferase family 2 protein [Poseidonibacter]MBU3014485.1 glycosyltransferase family 2 protein [Poseidonibacter lekithochrous]MDO6827783.1 glycosyltransferase family 2 protein [Poseidonibacter sp. 1_MG-2023]
MKQNEIIVIIPTLNNDNTIQAVVNDVLKHNYKVIVIDDGYTNPVKNILTPNDNLTIIRHDINLGKGEAILSGAREAKKLGYDYFVSIDGDGQHLASEIEKIIVNCNEKDQIIIGARDFDIENVPNGSKFGRWFSNFWATWDTEQEIKDSLSGFRLYPTSILDLDIKTSRFDWEMEVLVKHSWKGRTIKEVIVDCYYPTPEERVSHFKKFWDTAAIVMVHIRLLPLKTFLKKRYK